MDCGNVIDLEYNNKIISAFENLNFIDKIGLISKLIIRYDNDELEVVLSWYDIVYLIMKYKEKVNFSEN